MVSRAMGLAALCLVLAVSLVQAARIPTDDPWAMAQKAFQDMLITNRVQDKKGHRTTEASAVEHRRRGGDDDKREYEHGMLNFALRFRVWPDEHEDFIDQWKDVEEEVYDEYEKSVNVFDLKKTITDNIFFFFETAWENPRDMADFFKSKTWNKFKDYLDDEDIEWDLFPFRNITDTKGERRYQRALCANAAADDVRCHKKGGKGRQDEDENMAHVLIKYFVPPSQREDFVSAWQDVADGTYKEDDNIVYELRQDVLSNTDFYVHGTWESFEAYTDHFHSKHVHRFRQTIAEQGVVWFLTPLKSYGEMEH